MRRHSSILLLAFALAGGGIGCTVEQPHTGPRPATSDMGRAMDKPDMEKPDDGIVNPPVLDPVQQTTAWDSIPVHGTAEPGSSVIIEDEHGNTVAAEVLANGRFCQDAPLINGALNRFTVHTVDANGTASESIQFTVTQQGAVTQRPAAPTPENAAVGGGATASFWSSNKVTTQFIDGADDSGIVGYAIPNAWSIVGLGISGALDWNEYSYDRVMVQLAQVSRVDRIVIKGTSDCPLTAPFSVWVSGAQSSSDPKVDPNGWQRLKDVAANGVPSTGLDLTMPTAIIGQIAILFEHGYWTAPWSDDLNCGGILNGYHPKYGFSEIQAWTTPGQPAPPPVKPSCGSGG